MSSKNKKSSANKKQLGKHVSKPGTKATWWSFSENGLLRFSTSTCAFYGVERRYSSFCILFSWSLFYCGTKFIGRSQSDWLEIVNFLLCGGGMVKKINFGEGNICVGLCDVKLIQQMNGWKTKQIFFLNYTIIWCQDDFSWVELMMICVFKSR